MKEISGWLIAAFIVSEQMNDLRSKGSEKIMSVPDPLFLSSIEDF